MNSKLLDPIIPLEDLRMAALDLTWEDLKSRLRPEAARELEAVVDSTRTEFIVRFGMPDAVDPVFSFTLSFEEVEAYVRARMKSEQEIEHPTGASVLRLTALLLPGSERADWLEEQRGYLADMPKLRARWGWIFAQLLAMPRYAYTVRTARERESA